MRRTDPGRTDPGSGYGHEGRKPYSRNWGLGESFVGELTKAMCDEMLRRRDLWVEREVEKESAGEGADPLSLWVES